MESTLFRYMIISTIVLIFLGLKWGRKGFSNFSTKTVFLGMGSWGLYEIGKIIHASGYLSF
jgi:hypothetical protein